MVREDGRKKGRRELREGGNALTETTPIKVLSGLLRLPLLHPLFPFLLFILPCLYYSTTAAAPQLILQRRLLYNQQQQIHWRGMCTYEV